MEFVTNNWLEIVNTIFVAIVALVLFSQKTRIKSLQDFVSIFDVKKLKQSTDYIIQGQQSKHAVDIVELQNKYESEMQSLKEQIKESVSATMEAGDGEQMQKLVYRMGFSLSRTIHYNLARIDITKSLLLSTLLMAKAESNFKYDFEWVVIFNARLKNLSKRNLDMFTKIRLACEEIEEGNEGSLERIKNIEKDYLIDERNTDSAISDLAKFNKESGLYPL